MVKLAYYRERMFVFAFVYFRILSCVLLKAQVLHLRGLRSRDPSFGLLGQLLSLILFIQFLLSIFEFVHHGFLFLVPFDSTLYEGIMLKVEALEAFRSRWQDFISSQPS